MNGLKVQKGYYYLYDNGYANSDGFLTPYKSVRYHLKEWAPSSSAPQNLEELFNIRHTKARNVIERAFGIMKMRWGILKSASYYLIKTQNRLIMACFLLHNFIRTQMEVDPFEENLDIVAGENYVEEQDNGTEYIDYVEASPEWTHKRDAKCDYVAQEMWNLRSQV